MRTYYMVEPMSSQLVLISSHKLAELVAKGVMRPSGLGGQRWR